MNRYLISALTAILASTSHAQDVPQLKLRAGWDDIPVKDYSHLWIKLPKVKAEDNGLPALSKLKAELETLAEFKQGYSEIMELQSEERLKQMTLIYNKVEHKFDEIDKALAKPHLYEKCEYSISSVSKMTIEMIELARYLHIRTVVLASQGKQELALKAYQQQILLSDKLRKDGITLVNLLVAMAIENGELNSADILLKHSGKDQAMRKRIVALLKRPLAHKSSMKRAMQSEFLYTNIIIKQMCDGDAKMLDYIISLLDGNYDEMPDEVGFWDVFKSPARMHSYTRRKAFKIALATAFQPQKTAREYYKCFQLRCRLIELPAHELVQNKELKEVSEKLKARRHHWVKPSSNMVGELLYTLGTESIDRQIVRMYTNPQGRDLLIVRDALRRYRDGTGKLPKNLTVLVPKYLDKVPTDLFSKTLAPIQYDKAKGLVWSVGVDGVDSFKDLGYMGNYKKGNEPSQGVTDKQPRMFVD